MRHAVTAPVALAALLSLAAAPVVAQDAQQWTYGYGPVGQFTGGTLVGGVGDLSAVYYNPAALSLMEEPRFVLSLSSVELSNINAPDAGGAGLGFDATIFHGLPGMLAGHLGTNRGQRDHFAWAILSRFNMDWDLALNRATVQEGLAGYGRVRQRLLEYWGGVGWSHRLRPGLSLGVTPFLSYRLQRSRRMLELDQLSAAGQAHAFVAHEDEYDYGRLLAKAALAWRPAPWELGLTVTTPSLRLYDHGKVVFDASRSGPGGPSWFSASLQDSLDARYHAPWSVAAGVSRRGPSRVVHTSVEWFASADPYDILSPQDAAVSGTNDTVALGFRGAAASIFNFGLGLEQQLGRATTLYAGATRNASSWQPGAETLASWDLTQLTAGLSFQLRHARVAVGLGYGWGDGPMPAPVVALYEPSPESARVRYRRLTGSAGFTLQRED